ncbi:MAG: endonuclease/exonuclease/phosphatase family protein [Firmicutes bacterium]|nr:endonuclease/exonuclease/phosphatase family protein [Bacillota bacterium]
MFKIMTFNVRIDVPVDKENGWPYRKQAISEYIKKELPVVLGIQEANQHMLDELMSFLPMYQFIGLPREEGTEYSAILYLKTKAKCLKTDTIWLSDTPRRTSKFQESAFPRIATMGRFEIQGKTYDFINTHLDYLSVEVAFKQMKVLVNELNNLSDSSVLMGDFNCPPHSIVDLFLRENGWILPYDETINKQASFHAFTKNTTGSPIDFIYGRKKIRFHQVFIDQSTTDPICLSDHYPVLAIID